MADISGASDELEKFIEAIRKANSSLSDGNDLANEFIGDEKDRNRTLAKEYSNLGLTLGDHNKVVRKDIASLEERAKNEKLVNDTLKASGKVRADATKEEIEAYKLTQRQNEAFRAQLDAMGKYLDETGKVIDTSVKLSTAQQRQLNQEKISSDKQNQKEQARGEIQTKLATNFAATNIIVTGLTVGFELLKAGVQGTYKGMLAMQDAALAGAEDDTVRAAFVAQQSDSLAGAFRTVGTMALSSAIGLGGLAIVAGAVTAPLLLIVGGLAALGIIGAGLANEYELKSKRDKEQAEQSKNLFAGFQQLSNASLMGADGITGLYRDLHKVGLTVAEFEKFNKVLSANTKEMAMFGGNTISGVKLFTKQAGDLLNSDLGRTLEIMGVGAEEQYKHQMSYMTMQSQFGLKVNGDIKNATYNYINELDKLAVLTGISRKEQEDNRNAIMAIQQLRAAQLKAEEDGDTKKSAMLQRAVMDAALMMEVDKQLAAGNAKLAASGGVAYDDDTIRSKQTFSGKGGYLESLESGQGSSTDRFRIAMGQALRQESKFAPTNITQGGLKGLTSMDSLGRIMDVNKGLRDGKSTDEVLNQIRTNTDPATAAQVDRNREGRNFKLATDDMVKAGYSFGDATKLFGQSVNAFVTGKPMPNPSGGAASGAASGADNGSATMKAQLANQVGSVNGKKAEDDLLTFGSGSGSRSNFAGLKPHMQEKVLAAAADYKALTGRKLHINSANRSPEKQKELYQETKDAGRPGIGPTGMRVAEPGGSSHESGLAVDIQNYHDSRAVRAMNKQGLFQTVKDDPVHFTIPKAMGGGVFSGSSGGYPVMLHEREVAVPLPDPSSKIRIETPTKDPLSSVMADNSVSTSTSTTTNAMMTGIFEMMSSKMDDMIDKLDRGNGYSDKLVKAMA